MKGTVKSAPGFNHKAERIAENERLRQAVDKWLPQRCDCGDEEYCLHCDTNDIAMWMRDAIRGDK